MVNESTRKLKKKKKEKQCIHPLQVTNLRACLGSRRRVFVSLACGVHARVSCGRWSVCSEWSKFLSVSFGVEVECGSCTAALSRRRNRTVWYHLRLMWRNVNGREGLKKWSFFGGKIWNLQNREWKFGQSGQQGRIIQQPSGFDFKNVNTFPFFF